MCAELNGPSKTPSKSRVGIVGLVSILTIAGGALFTFMDGFNTFFDFIERLDEDSGKTLNSAKANERCGGNPEVIDPPPNTEKSITSNSFIYNAAFGSTIICFSNGILTVEIPQMKIVKDYSCGEMARRTSENEGIGLSPQNGNGHIWFFVNDQDESVKNKIQIGFYIDGQKEPINWFFMQWDCSAFL